MKKLKLLFGLALFATIFFAARTQPALAANGDTSFFISNTLLNYISPSSGGAYDVLIDYGATPDMRVHVNTEEGATAAISVSISGGSFTSESPDFISGNRVSHAVTLPPVDGHKAVTVSIIHSDTNYSKTYTLNFRVNPQLKASDIAIKEGDVKRTAGPTRLAYSEIYNAPSYDEYEAQVGGGQVTVSVTARDGTVVRDLSEGPYYVSAANPKVDITFTISNAEGSISRPVVITLSYNPLIDKSTATLLSRLTITNNGTGDFGGSNASWDEKFSSAIFSYRVEVSPDASAITLTPAVYDNRSTITVNGVGVISGRSHTINLPPATSAAITYTVTIVVKANGGAGAAETYTVTIVREGLSTTVPELRDLGVSYGSDTRHVDINPSFSKDITAYSAFVPSDASYLEVVPQFKEIPVSYTVNNKNYNNGEVYRVKVDLNSGPSKNTVTVNAVAPDGSVGKTYTIDVYRAAPAAASSANPASNIEILSGQSGDATLPYDPAFNSVTKIESYTFENRSHTAYVDVDYVRFKVELSAPSYVLVDDKVLMSGATVGITSAFSVPPPLPADPNPNRYPMAYFHTSFKVLSPDFTKSYTYQFTVIRGKDGPIVVSQGEIIETHWYKGYDWRGNAKFSTTSAGLIIESADNNAAWYEQRIALEKNTVYRLSANIKAENFAQGDEKLGGATVGVDIDEYNADYVTSNEWRRSTITFNTGNRTEVNLRLKLGNHSAVVKGKVYFKDITLEKISAAQTAGEKPITVTLNGAELEFDQPPIIENDRTLVPMRKIFEAMGATVEWDGETQTITAVKDNVTIIMRIGNPVMTKNGVQNTLDVPPKIVNNRTLVPVRAVAESLDCEVGWDGNARSVSIIAENGHSLSDADSEIAFNVGYNMGYIQGESDRETNASFALPVSEGLSKAEKEEFDEGYTQGWAEGYAGMKNRLEETASQ
ncbi:MAG: cadherin-like beta sandwich domain-containing protein [Oscillospiraceae bacterium]|nr:cadherin-like beta sandwich domain-containing protein [Oscillospiraceae bacterium]